MNLIFRHETPADYRAVEEMTRAAFWNLHVPGCDEHYLVHVLRDHPDYLPELSFVAEMDGEIAGHILFTRARVEDTPVLCFGPLTVLPKFQRRGIGAALITHGCAVAAGLGHRAVLIYGFPKYYLNRGFIPASRYKITTAAGMYLPALMARELTPGGLCGISGRFVESAGFQVAPEEVQAFDCDFPVWEKLSGLPHQAAFAQEGSRATHPTTEAVAAVAAVLEGERDVLAGLSVVPSVLNHYLPALNWVGFYLLRAGELVVGPFQGQPPCMRIPLGKGVCGAAATRRVAVRVDNVHAFPGHIACDVRSNSELVIPIFCNGALYGVLDLDSPYLARFTQKDEDALTEAMDMLGTWLAEAEHPDEL